MDLLAQDLFARDVFFRYENNTLSVTHRYFTHHEKRRPSLPAEESCEVDDDTRGEKVQAQQECAQDSASPALWWYCCWWNRADNVCTASAHGVDKNIRQKRKLWRYTPCLLTNQRQQDMQRNPEVDYADAAGVSWSQERPQD